jgi:membrane protein required for colicin V production
VLGGAKGALAAWVLLSVVVLARELLPARVAGWVQGSDFVALARSHNLVAHLDPDAARQLERARVPRLPSVPALPQR